MENKGLIFIPDISGFTRFVNETEIDHSRLIIQELLEILINANETGLQVSEIEGDAILFYRFGEPPPLDEMYRQVERMFCDFHQNLIAYENRRYCQCTACKSAVNLSLKVITHYGEFTGYNVKNFSKLIGKDIIVAHQLLKNDIDQHEYWLVTKSLLQNSTPGTFKEWMQWSGSAKQTEIGEIPFQYTQLGQLKKEIPREPPFPPETLGKTKTLSFSREYNTDIITLFHATGDFNYRHRWQHGVKSVEEVGHFLPRVGMRCRCVLEDGEMMIRAGSYSYRDEQITFNETDEKTNHTTRFTLYKTGPLTTRLTLDYYVPGNLLQRLGFAVSGKKKTAEMFKRSIQNLETLVKEIRL
ncbi:DUF2652 domain-containing protein [Foetidibacter luteolus]|uniref:DUF2652 domain-containing protein n=1 Tax=Foetidibacter luteolus TaxID=2608880 RepID=UPI00129B0604|nr:DUF2652 domain-containing protein [Foetidibacter luteolus]